MFDIKRNNGIKKPIGIVLEEEIQTLTKKTKIK